MCIPRPFYKQLVDIGVVVKKMLKHLVRKGKHKKNIVLRTKYTWRFPFLNNNSETTFFSLLSIIPCLWEIMEKCNELLQYVSFLKIQKHI